MKKGRIRKAQRQHAAGGGWGGMRKGSVWPALSSKAAWEGSLGHICRSPCSLSPKGFEKLDHSELSIERVPCAQYLPLPPVMLHERSVFILLTEKLRLRKIRQRAQGPALHQSQVCLTLESTLNTPPHTQDERTLLLGLEPQQRLHSLLGEARNRLCSGESQVLPPHPKGFTIWDKEG